MAVAQDPRLKELGIISPQMAQAQGVINLSNAEGEAVNVLSVLTVKDLERFATIDAMADLTDWDWIRKIGTNELRKRCSVSRKGKRGRDDVVEVTKPDGQEHNGILDSFREKINNFIHSGT